MAMGPLPLRIHWQSHAMGVNTAGPEDSLDSLIAFKSDTLPQLALHSLEAMLVICGTGEVNSQKSGGFQSDAACRHEHSLPPTAALPA